MEQYTHPQGQPSPAAAAPMEEVPRRFWERFFRDFTRQHLGRLVTATLSDGRGDGGPMGSDLPFAGISFAEKQDPRRRVEILLGDSPERSFIHVIENPTRILQSTAARQRPALHIESADGQVLRLDFAPAP